MKNKKTVSALLLLTTLMSVASFPEHTLAQGQQRGTPPGMELPDGWEDMTEDERQTYMEANRPEGMGEGGGRGNGQMGTPPGMELPDGWDDMTEDEQKTYMEANRPEGSEEGARGNGNREKMELPDGWEDMTDDEKKVYREENRPEGTENIEKTQEKVAAQSSTSNYTKKVRKAQNYKKFSGTLQARKTFTDSSEIENKEAVSYLQQRGILGGYSDGSFGAKKSINRAESLKVLLEALGEEITDTTTSEFSDVPSGAWFTGYVNKAKELGIVKGYEDGTFQPGKTVNQVELMKIAFESFGIDLSDYTVTSLPSGTDSNAWYAKYLQYALDNDLLDEEDVNLSEGMDRESFSELVYRLIQQQEGL